MGYYYETEHAVFKYLLRQYEQKKIPFSIRRANAIAQNERPQQLTEGSFHFTFWDLPAAESPRNRISYRVQIHSDGSCRLALVCVAGASRQAMQASYGTTLANQLRRRISGHWEQMLVDKGGTRLTLVVRADISKPQDLLSLLGNYLPASIPLIDEAIATTNLSFPDSDAGLISEDSFQHQLLELQTFYNQVLGGGVTLPLPRKRLKTNRWSFLLDTQTESWDVFQQQQCISLLTPAELGDLRGYKSREQLAQALAGLGAEDGLETLDAFRVVKPGDVAIAFADDRRALGLGIVTGRGTYQPAADGPHRHSYSVYWALTDMADLVPQHFAEENSFVRTSNWDKAEALYKRQAPHLVPVLEAVAQDTFQQDFGHLLAVGKPLSANTSAVGVKLSAPAINTAAIYVLPVSTASPQQSSSTDLRATRAEERIEIRYWWFNVAAAVWRLVDCQPGRSYSWATHTAKGTRRRGYEHIAELQPGDQVLAFETTPDQRLKAQLVVVHGCHEDEEGREVVRFRVEGFFAREASWEELHQHPAVEQHASWQAQQDPVVPLSPEQYEQLLEAAQVPDAEGVRRYLPARAAEELLMADETLQQLLTALKRKKNLIIQGPPGVGKTFVAKRLAWLQMGCNDAERVQMVQFHQSYSYEDFIRGWRPQADGQGGFELANGVFVDFVRRAQHDPARDYFFIIDEINRGNLSKIFGELLLLLETDKRGPDYAVPLTYRREAEAPFYLPANLYLIGTMNTADRSLAMVDYALRRRFTFIELQPVIGQRLVEYLAKQGVPAAFSQERLDRVAKLNKLILEDRNLGRGFLLGHSYFCSPPLRGQLPSDWWQEIVEHEIRPMLCEYWFEDESRAHQAADELL